MPIYEFRDRCTGEVFEEVFVSWRDAPEMLPNPITGCDADRIVSKIQLGVVVDAQRAHERRLEKQGIVRYERGVENIASSARRQRERQQAEARDKIIADTLAAF